LLVAGAFYAYTVSAILVFIAIVPGFFAMWYAKGAIPPSAAPEHPTLTQALHDFRSVGAILFALLLFFQFGNEWSIAGWLPIFLIRRLGISPEASLFMLAIYWGSLLVGRIAALAMIPRVGHGKLLLTSAGAALSGCLVLLATNNRFGAVIGILMAGGGFAGIYPLAAEKIGRRFPYYQPGFFNGIFSFALTGGMLAPCVVGYLAYFWGVGVAMGLPLAGTCMVFVLVLLIWLEAKVRG
jgi:fucose permease